MLGANASSASSLPGLCSSAPKLAAGARLAARLKVKLAAGAHLASRLEIKLPGGAHLGTRLEVKLAGTLGPMLLALRCARMSFHAW
ncbi:hypothetical protein TSOC_012177 [Tetrabaena socialis]|uniref:Uncharacterized protein n=1 Tax=Tetrabaena socialis TaxID=47790 RepID=A0A2J7ZNN9_9CHLO|nr:hypothetical protein TSOC_012177 [Tetrabaena socialis]|eukprot:PNH01894.1 hypothetical protein TSOC_012177 [Tetrabaena socialis]